MLLMPIDHGIYRKFPNSPVQLTREQVAVFRYGIWNIFNAMGRGKFLADMAQKRALQLQFHFAELCRRLVFSLQHLNQIMQEMARLHAQPVPPLMTLDADSVQASIHADHVLSYLGTLVDDVAVVSTLAIDYSGPPDDPIDSMGKLKNKLKSKDNQTRQAMAPIASLLSELENVGSWWDLGFKRTAGGRQLLVHNQHLVHFGASSAAGGPFQVTAQVNSPWADKVSPYPDFFGLLRDIFVKLFEWLDRLEIALMKHLQLRDPSWKSTIQSCPSFVLPVAWPPGPTCLDPLYFPLPLCDGSDPLPWYGTGPLKPPLEFTHEEISYGAFCIDEEEKMKGRHNHPDVNWFKAKDRLSLVRSGLSFAQ
jgi:hypothetical protein